MLSYNLLALLLSLKAWLSFKHLNNAVTKIQVILVNTNTAFERILYCLYMYKTFVFFLTVN